MKNIISKISANKKQILVRTLIITGAVVGVTSAAYFIDVRSTVKGIKLAEAAAEGEEVLREAAKGIAKAAKKVVE